jgi:hypothetical protein
MYSIIETNVFRSFGIAYPADHVSENPTLSLTLGAGIAAFAQGPSLNIWCPKMEFISRLPSSLGDKSSDPGKPSNDYTNALHSTDSALPTTNDQDLETLIGQAFEKAVESMDVAWDRGDLTPEKIADALAEHRATHPYRND